ncbi:MAG TPA: AarF/ABC1/UbiB kinase family protein [Proteobacteria bacterium]|nr:AarF/ABC1/UbiB kinase family protein [Pseudomonadota bacterium]
MQRYRQILTVLFKYGFGDLVDSLNVEQYLEIGLQMVSRKRRKKTEKLTKAARLRIALEELGPTFIKLGQILSTRPDFLPVEFIKELEKLQDDVPPFPGVQAKTIIESELGRPIEDVFEHFEESPIASASLGQVHRARLADGEIAAVKVQRPDIRKTIEVDLEILLHMATLMEKHLEGWEIHKPTRIVAEFSSSLEKELDYNIEASHMEMFARNFPDDPTVYVPKVFHEATTKRILCMEYIEGIKPSDIQGLEESGLDRKAIASRGGDLIMKQIFVHGFFHADPHPGNLRILPDNVICYLDFGMMGRIDRQARENFAELAIGVIKRDEVKASEALLKLTHFPEKPDIRLLQRDVAEFMEQHFYGPLKDLDLGTLLHQLLNIVSRHHLGLYPELYLMLKAMSTVEGLGRLLDPDFDITGQAAPFIRRIRMERINPRRIFDEVTNSGAEILRLLKEIPGELSEILHLAGEGKIKMEFEHTGLEPLLSSHEKNSNQLAFAIVLASLVIGSSLIVLSDVPPKWHEIPVIGLAGFLVAGMMGFWLLVSILKRGKM